LGRSGTQRGGKRAGDGRRRRETVARRRNQSDRHPPKAENESPDQAGTSDPQEGVAGAPDAIGTEKRGATPPVASASLSSPTSSAEQVDAPEMGCGPRGAGGTAGRNSAESGTTAPTHPSKRRPPLRANTPGEIASAGPLRRPFRYRINRKHRRRSLSLQRQCKSGSLPAEKCRNRFLPRIRSMAVSNRLRVTRRRTRGHSGLRAGEADPVDGDRLPRQLHIRVSAWRPQLVPM